MKVGDELFKFDQDLKTALENEGLYPENSNGWLEEVFPIEIVPL